MLARNTLQRKSTRHTLKYAVCFNLENAVGSRKSTQAIGAPSKTEKLLITSKVTTNFSVSLCTPLSYASFSRPTALSRFNHDSTHMSISSKSLVSYKPSIKGYIAKN